MATLEIKTAEEFKTLAELERQASRRAVRETPLVQLILRFFVDRGERIPVDDIVAAFPGSPPGTIREALIGLDDDDVIRVRDGHVDITYPFSASPTPFVVSPAGGDGRYACCAVDALGMAPMLGRQIQVRSRCHHSGVPLEFSVAPDGPGPGAKGIMLWFGKRGDEPCKVADSL